LSLRSTTQPTRPRFSNRFAGSFSEVITRAGPRATRCLRACRALPSRVARAESAVRSAKRLACEAARAAPHSPACESGATVGRRDRAAGAASPCSAGLRPRPVVLRFQPRQATRSPAGRQHVLVHRGLQRRLRRCDLCLQLRPQPGCRRRLRLRGGRPRLRPVRLSAVAARAQGHSALNRDCMPTRAVSRSQRRGAHLVS
jgi:hypothetical protein